MRKLIPLVLILACCLGACTSTEVETFSSPAERSVDQAFVKSGTDFSRFKRLRAAPLEIYFYEGQGQPSAEVVERIRGIFRSAFLDAIGDDYALVEEAGADVLGVRASLVDLRHSQALGALPVKGRAARLVANGQLTFFMELTDSVSGQVLARAGDRERPPAAPSVTDLDESWAVTEREARRWAALFRDFLDKNLGQR